MLQRFLQGTLINTLTVYLRELELPDGPTHSSYYRTIDDAYNKSDDGQHSQAHCILL